MAQVSGSPAHVWERSRGSFSFWLQLDPALALAGICGVNLQIGGLCLVSAFQDKASHEYSKNGCYKKGGGRWKDAESK